MAFDTQLLDMLACPVCKGKLDYNAEQDELICRFDRLAYPIREAIPVMLENEARQLSLEELEAMKK
ncbi:Trm112 family protein [Aestuariibacter salexigens]|uniref:Trm112 family protein n=1 Tax=Aestuariibacter salexigens TaxID=226010 RepID=UPI0004017DD5|nr:Trm112 family protein [Aestuariibacter salexigens]